MKITIVYPRSDLSLRSTRVFVDGKEVERVKEVTITPQSVDISLHKPDEITVLCMENPNLYEAKQ